MSNNSSPYKLLIADPNAVIAYGCEAIIKKMNAFRTQVIVCTDFDELVKTANLLEPDFIWVNPLISGVRADAKLTSLAKEQVIALLYDNMKPIHYVGYRTQIAISAGEEEIIAQFNMIKDADVPALPEEDEKNLSPREVDVVTLVAKGFTNKEIASQLSLSPHTVITHRRNIARKLDIHSPSGITIYAIMRKLVRVEETSLR